MTTGGLGSYNPDFEGFTTNNTSSAVRYAGVMDTVTNTSQGYIRDLFDMLLHVTTESGAYGAGWASIASNLPANPDLGRLVGRVNTDESNASRLYFYNGSAWVYLEFT